MRYRFVAVPLTLTVVLSLAACGGSSKSKTTGTSASPAVTQSSTASAPATTTAPATTSTPAAGTNAAVCQQAINDLRPLQQAAATNNAREIVTQAGQVVPKLIALQSHPGISPATHAALGQLTGALEAFAHGGRGQATATQLSTAGSNLAAACR